jgi:hypothetical protein
MTAPRATTGRGDVIPDGWVLCTDRECWKWQHAHPAPLASAPVRAEEPHPEYGPCDGFGPGRACSECGKDQFSSREEWEAWMRHPVAPPAADARPRSYDERRDWYTDGQHASDCAPETAAGADATARNPRTVGEDADLTALAEAAEEVVCRYIGGSPLNGALGDAIDRLATALPTTRRDGT